MATLIKLVRMGAVLTRQARCPFMSAPNPTNRPAVIPASANLFALLGVELLPGDLAHLRRCLPHDDLARCDSIVCEYFRRWCDGMADTDNSSDKQQRGRWTANKWLTLGGHKWAT